MKTKDELRQERLSKELDESKLISMLKTEGLSVHEIAKRFDVPVQTVHETIKKLTFKKVMLHAEDQEYSIHDTPQEGGHKQLNPKMWQGDILRFGFLSDNHLCSNFERLDVLHLLYDLYESEGIKTVLNGGNWIEGESRFNKNEIHVHGFGRQIDYAVKNYPYKKDIQTWFISGDDHEGWYNQREGINSGEYFQMMREEAGMHDLKHLGYVEADIDLNKAGYEIPMWCRVMHPGGGSAYAISYAGQKIVESLQGGEKPHLLFIGHFHKLSYNLVRNVHVIQMGTTKDQDIFMRKKKISAHVGGGIVELRRGEDGLLNRVKVEFITAYDKKFYVGKDKYWK